MGDYEKPEFTHCILTVKTALNISNLEIGFLRKKGVEIKVAGPIDMDVSAGSLICLLGPNGVGKTTLLRTIAGILPSLNGTISIHTQDVSTINKKKLAKLLSDS